LTYCFSKELLPILFFFIERWLKMLITHLNSYFIASRLHAELVSALDKAGIAQKVFVPVQKAGLVGKNKPEGLLNSEVVYDHCFNTLDRYLWPLKMQKIWLAFKKFYQKHPASLNHAHTLIVNGLIAYWAKQKWDIPYVVTIRNTDLNFFFRYLPFFRGIGLKVLQEAAHIVAVSPAYRNKQLAKHFSGEVHQAILDKSTVIPNGINDFWIQHRQQKTAQSKTPTIIFVGRLDKNKNLPTLIKSCKILSGNGFQVKLMVVGDGPLLPTLRAKQYDFPVEFYGKITQREKILALYRQSDLLVVPSHAETFGLVYPEAMSQGLPVIYTRDQGFDGFFPDGQVGFAVNPNSPQDIAGKIKLIFADYEQMSANALDASKEFSWNIVTEKLIQLYQSIHQ
jgi:glycosyltransferase involved in cell wall biosynthesis